MKRVRFDVLLPAVGLGQQRRGVSIHPTELFGHAPPKATADKNQNSSTGATNSAATAGTHSSSSRQSAPFRFAIKDSERGLLDHGLTPDARRFVAEAEDQYRRSFEALHAVPGGSGAPEKVRVESADGNDDETESYETATRIAAPFGETFVPSSKERFAHRGSLGQLEAMQDRTHGRRDEDVAFTKPSSTLAIKTEREIQRLLSSPNTALLEKCEMVSSLVSRMIVADLPIQARTVDGVFSLWTQTRLLALSGRVQSSSPESAGEMNLSASGIHPKLLESYSVPQPLPAASARLLYFENMKELYTHMRKHFVAPTPLIMEQLMVSLSLITKQDTDTFHVANRILLDADKFVVLPSRTTYTAYFDVCRHNAAMSFAVQRFQDAIRHLRIEADSTMTAALLKGLNHNGLVQEAVALLSRTEHLPVDVDLFNVTLETLLLSEQPLSCFAAFESTLLTAGGSGRRGGAQPSPNAPFFPNADTYTLLLLACEKSGQWERTTQILADMQHRHVRGNEMALNLLLKGLLLEKLLPYASQLHRAMTAKSIPVWPALEETLAKRQKKGGRRLSGGVAPPQSRTQRKGRKGKGVVAQPADQL